MPGTGSGRRRPDASGSPNCIWMHSTAVTRPFSATTRTANLTRMAEGRFDVLVVGGGITGVGIALDAAARGLSVALVEKDDFASGTSGRSSRMVHGGLRYLEHREFGLVRDGAAHAGDTRRVGHGERGAVVHLDGGLDADLAVAMHGEDRVVK